MGDVAKAGIRTTTDGTATAGTAAGAAGVDEPEAGVVEAVEVVELLVPGLGPVDRDALLWPRGVDRISGDNKAGLYRAGQPDTGVVPGTSGQPLVREVYDWTRLTIGGASRALWLFLLPFLLVNRVAWMQPRWPSGADGRLTKAAGALYEFGARLLALTLTVLVVGTFGHDIRPVPTHRGTAGVPTDRGSPGVLDGQAVDSVAGSTVGATCGRRGGVGGLRGQLRGRSPCAPLQSVSRRLTAPQREVRSTSCQRVSPGKGPRAAGGSGVRTV